MNPEKMMQIMTEQALALALEVLQAHPELPRDELAAKMVETWHARPCNADQINLLDVAPHHQGGFRFLVGQLTDIREILITKAELEQTQLQT